MPRRDSRENGHDHELNCGHCLFESSPSPHGHRFRLCSDSLQFGRTGGQARIRTGLIGRAGPAHFLYLARDDCVTRSTGLQMELIINLNVGAYQGRPQEGQLSLSAQQLRKLNRIIALAQQLIEDNKEPECSVARTTLEYVVQAKSWCSFAAC